jgi:putative SOS response-associated peptidase YedK
MCGRFARKSTQDILAEWFDLELDEMPWFAPSYNVAPQSVQPVVRLGRDSGRPEMAVLRWGLVPFWAKDEKIAYSTINARAEEAASRPAYREALKRRRCLVPADAFYEWQRHDTKSKRPFAFAMASGEPYAFAGLWESWRPKDKDPSFHPKDKDPSLGTPGRPNAPVGTETLETFTILTTGPNELMEPVHNRMPVILERKDYGRWLDPGDPARPPVDLLRPFPAERMRAWPVASRVGNVRNNDAQLLEPVSMEPSSVLFPEGA